MADSSVSMSTLPVKSMKMEREHARVGSAEAPVGCAATESKPSELKSGALTPDEGPRDAQTRCTDDWSALF